MCSIQDSDRLSFPASDLNMKEQIWFNFLAYLFVTEYRRRVSCDGELVIAIRCGKKMML